MHGHDAPDAHGHDHAQRCGFRGWLGQTVHADLHVPSFGGATIRVCPCSNPEPGLRTREVLA